MTVDAAQLPDLAHLLGVRVGRPSRTRTPFPDHRFASVPDYRAGQLNGQLLRTSE
ncbi:hypothetical protein [Deinococcus aquaticus]|uniref:hypothetical protein n=1 Tax=Deinococcus aquaticus TaxID=328692 RepID=UPI00362096F9